MVKAYAFIEYLMLPRSKLREVCGKIYCGRLILKIMKTIETPRIDYIMIAIIILSIIVPVLKMWLS